MKRVAMLSTRGLVTEICKTIGKSIDEKVEDSIKVLEDNWLGTVESLRLVDDKNFFDLGVPTSLVEAIKEWLAKSEKSAKWIKERANKLPARSPKYLDGVDIQI